MMLLNRDARYAAAIEITVPKKVANRPIQR